MPTSLAATIFFSEIFGRQARANIRMRGQDAHYRLALDFLDAINGGKRQLTLPDGSVLDVTIPPGTRDGQILRLRGKGRPGIGGGPPGDALIEIEVRPHRIFTRKGDDIHVELPISLREAVLGGKVKVPTPSGAVTMTHAEMVQHRHRASAEGKRCAAAGRQSRRRIRHAQGDAAGKPDPELEKFVAQWRPATARNPREAMEV